MAISMSYESYDFGAPEGPIPLFTMNKEIIKTGGQHTLGTKIVVTLNGTLLTQVDSSTDDGTGIDVITESINKLKDAFQEDYGAFTLNCNGTIYKGYPIVRSLDFNHRDDNYVRLADYTIVLEFNRFDKQGKDGFEPHGYKQGETGQDSEETDLTSYGLLSASDEISIEWYNASDGGILTFFGVEKPSIVSIQRSLSAQGMGMSNKVDGKDYSAEERARKWIMDQIDSDVDGIKGLFCVDYELISEVRTATSNKLEGNCSTNVTYLLSKDSDSRYVESFEASVERAAESPLTTIAINGTIQGFADIDYGPSVDVTDCNNPTNNKSAMDYASEGWDIIKDKVYTRAQTLFDSLEAHAGLLKGTLRESLLSDSLGYNTEAGTLTYSRSYNNREEFYYDEALVETVSYNTSNGTDIYASLTVLGRANGPLFQNMGTKTAETRDLAIDAIVQPISQKTDFGVSNAITVEYTKLVDAYEASLIGVGVVYFRNSDTESWEPLLGHYTRSVSWTVGTC